MSVLSSFKDLPVAFGGASISGEGAGYGFGNISETNAIDLLLEAFDLGIKVYDTAPIYGFGLSEKRIGKAFKMNREKVFIISKSGVTWGTNKRVDMSNDPKVAEKMLHQSLIDLDSEYIDLYMVHWPDSKFDIRETLEVYHKAKNQGKIKHIGLCNTNLDDLKKASEIDHIEVVQSEFNIFSRGIQKELFPEFKKQNIDFMSWGTLEKGIISGTVTKDRKFEDVDCRKSAPWWKQMDFETRYKVMDALKPFLAKHGLSGVDLALKYNFSFEEVSMVLCGMRNSKQLNGVVDSYKKQVSKDILNEAKEIIELSMK